MPEELNTSQLPGTPKLLHYRLTTEEWLHISQELRPAELRILYYLRTLDPFGDRHLELKVIDIAEATRLQKGTVSKALRVLFDKGYIDLEMITVRVQVKKFPPENQVSSRKLERTPGNLDAQQETSAHGRKPECTAGNFQSLEPKQEASSRTPQTIQTIQTDQSLSNSERETTKQDPEFRAWLCQKAAQLPQPPQLLEQWIDRQATLEANQRDFLKAKQQRTNRTNVPPPPNRFQIESACIGAIDAGDRGFVLAKLQQLWRDGWHDLIEDLCTLYPTWGIEMTNDGPVEVDGWLT